VSAIVHELIPLPERPAQLLRDLWPPPPEMSDGDTSLAWFHRCHLAGVEVDAVATLARTHQTVQIDLATWSLVLVDGRPSSLLVEVPDGSLLVDDLERWLDDAEAVLYRRNAPWWRAFRERGVEIWIDDVEAQDDGELACFDVGATGPVPHPLPHLDRIVARAGSDLLVLDGTSLLAVGGDRDRVRRAVAAHPLGRCVAWQPSIIDVLAHEERTRP